MTQEIREWAIRLAECAGQDQEQARAFVTGLENCRELQEEFCYYYEHQDFLCKYRVAGYTVADVLVWQVDHFKLYMDRPEDMNRYRQPRLLLASFDTMLQMEEDPASFAEKMRCETGQDIL